ncbi:hypothetical protein E5676_scaffold83G00530 [Cucumis melo var. makuwa]|uniref:Uncharacterized protein n=1 Tax=Cucumis melo var. makuwa TaxID=1194695 RepID=A0A5A7TG74_CUCMM|nr:hypothetical protein E6C27_scaffold67G002410 [Cucumis melo var. makuwa]TYK05381.1 hypothetical protein E5676_scaffold83G00530 [Cucumis melo var. makuwa]
MLVEILENSHDDANGVVALDVGTILTRRWWSITSKSKNVNMARLYWISQVTHVILARANPKSAEEIPRLSSVEAKRRMDFRRCRLVKEESVEASVRRKARAISRLVRPNLVSQRAKESKNQARGRKASHL